LSLLLALTLAAAGAGYFFWTRRRAASPSVAPGAAVAPEGA
jgi:hypothetical protein